MKKILFPILTICVLIVGCSKQKEEKLPIEGTWKLVAVYTPQTPSDNFDDLMKNGEIKTWSKEYFTWISQTDQDTMIQNFYGAGTYKLNGNQYEEHIMYFFNPEMVNKDFKGILEIRNDTLYQKYNSEPLAESYELQGEYYTEVFVRLK